MKSSSPTLALDRSNQQSELQKQRTVVFKSASSQANLTTKYSDQYLEQCIEDMKYPVFGYPLMNFNQLRISQIPPEFTRPLSRNHIASSGNLNKRSALNLTSKIGETGCLSGGFDLEDDSRLSDTPEQKKVPNFEKAWRRMSRTVIKGNNQDFHHMIQSYQKNESKMQEKIREFTFGGKNRLRNYQLKATTEDQNMLKGIKSKKIYDRQKKSSRNGRGIETKVNTVNAFLNRGKSTEDKRIMYNYTTGSDFYKISNRSTLFENQDQTNATTSNLSAFLGSSLNRTTDFKKNLMTQTSFYQHSGSKINSSVSLGHRDLNSTQGQTQQSQGQNIERIIYYCIGDDGNLIENEELLERWLKSKEGQEFIAKYKLWHLKKEKPSPIIKYRTAVNTNNNNTADHTQSQTTKRYSKHRLVGLGGYGYKPEGEVLDTAEKIEEKIQKLSLTPQKLNKFLKGKLLVENYFSRSLRKHLNVVSESNAYQAKQLQNSAAALNLSQDDTIIDPRMLPESYKRLLQREKEKENQEKNAEPDKISVFAINHRDRMNFENESQSSFVKIHQKNRGKLISNKAKQKFTDSKKRYNTPQKTYQKERYKSVVVNKTEEDNLHTNDNMNQQSPAKNKATVTHIPSPSNSLPHDVYKSDVEMLTRDYEPIIPHLELDKIASEGSCSFGTRSIDPKATTSTNGRNEVDTNSTLRPLSPILEEVRTRNREDDDEPEPMVPTAGYDYEKFKSEASIFIQGSASSNKLSMISENVKVSQAYLQRLRERKKGNHLILHLKQN